MLRLELAGKTVTTTAEKQTIKINGNPIEIERVGNSIYVNQLPINLIIDDNENKWKNILFLAFLVPMIGIIAYTVGTNGDTIFQGFSTTIEFLLQGFNATVDFVQTSVIPTVDSTVDAVGGMIDGNEADTSGN